MDIPKKHLLSKEISIQNHQANQNVHSVLSESGKVMRIYLVDGFCNTLVAPFFGTSILTPFIESAAGISVGARTGLASVVTGSLFLISTLFASSIAEIIPPEASGSAIVIACFSIIQCLQYVDFSMPTKAYPALFSFILIPFTNSIAIGASYGFVVLFGIWIVTPHIVKVKPQMIVTFWLALLLLLIETGLVTSSIELAAILGGVVVLSLVISFIFLKYRNEIVQRFGDSEFTKGVDSIVNVKSNNSKSKNTHSVTLSPTNQSPSKKQSGIPYHETENREPATIMLDSITPSELKSVAPSEFE